MQFMTRNCIKGATKEHIDNMSFKSLYVLSYNKDIHFVILPEFNRDVDRLNFKYDDYLSCNDDIDLFLNNEIDLNELIDRLYINVNSFIFSCNYKYMEEDFIVDVFKLDDLILSMDLIHPDSGINSIGVYIKDDVVQGFSTNSLKPIQEITVDYDYIIAFTDEVLLYKKRNLTKQVFKKIILEKVALFLFQKLVLIPKLNGSTKK